MVGRVQAGHGWARLGVAGRGMALLGEARFGRARSGEARQVLKWHAVCFIADRVPLLRRGKRRTRRTHPAR
jgi:hypothetical protein